MATILHGLLPYLDGYEVILRERLQQKGPIGNDGALKCDTHDQ